MRYWRLINTNRVIAVNVLMVPERWIEITKEEFDKLALLREKK